MTNLTEQWKKGELPSDWYWVKMSFQGAIIPLYYSEDYGFEYDDHFFDFEEISEVLAPVPSYEEWKAILEENTKLKSLLKECVEVLNDAQRNYGYDDSILDICSPIITKIDQVLGEE